MEAAHEIASNDPSVVLITGDVEQEMDHFKSQFPNQFYNLGMCEQAITGLAAGLAIEGLRPILYSITPFILERPFEQIKIDIDEQCLPVILVGFADYPTHGPTHRPLNPERTVSAFKNTVAKFPTSSAEAAKNLRDAYLEAGPTIIFLRRDA